MGVPSEPDLERASSDGNGGAPADIEMVRFLREEIRTAVQHELATTSTAPPSYDSTAPLLIEDPPAANPPDDTNAEVQDANQLKQKPKGWRAQDTAIYGGPYCAVILGMAVLSMLGVDNLLEVKALALCLLVTMYFVWPPSLILCSCVSAIALRYSPKTPTEQPGAEAPPNPEVGATAPTNPGAPTAAVIGASFTWHFFFCYMAFIGVVYCWASVGQRNNSLLGQYKAAQAFDGKLGMLGGLERLVKCLGEAEEIQTGKRFAGVGDIAMCLASMGVKSTGFVDGVMCINVVTENST